MQKWLVVWEHCSPKSRLVSSMYFSGFVQRTYPNKLGLAVQCDRWGQTGLNPRCLGIYSYDMLWPRVEQRKLILAKEKKIKKTQQHLHFPQFFCFCFFLFFLLASCFFLCFLLFCFFLDFGFLVCFFGLLWFCFCLFFDKIYETLYSLCCWTRKYIGNLTYNLVNEGLWGILQ